MSDGAATERRRSQPSGSTGPGLQTLSQTVKLELKGQATRRGPAVRRAGASMRFFQLERVAMAEA